ncbi:MAG: cell division protein ZapA [Pelagibacteraceae bacterium]|jgi:cell division protein ZapA|nr:cell division protein ZapA [Pelagibacteraceae bacterium]MCI5078914.1 cell division protein ZapA [Pelagibacteraceae bacterium]|tara:strand:- start:7969 stop:8397 length:429 start_codon:yes stop_codon:yes gene_type:complete
MVNVNVNFNGRDYLLACEEGQEEDLQKLTEELGKKFNQLKKDLGNLGEGKLLLITAIQVIDELYTLKTSLKKLKDHSSDLESKFKEIKNLSISYKEDRDKEVEELKVKLDELKKTIEENQNNYTQILNKASESINSFITKAV